MRLSRKTTSFWRFCISKSMSVDKDKRYECIVTYEVAIAIQEGSPRVSRVDGCVGLDHILHCHAHQVICISKCITMLSKTNYLCGFVQCVLHVVYAA